MILITLNIELCLFLGLVRLSSPVDYAFHFILMCVYKLVIFHLLI